MGEFEAAKQILTASITLSPNGGFSKYMNLGQLIEGQDAISMYQKGVELMLERKNQMNPESDEARNLSQYISTGFSSAAEIYLTDSCYDENAEHKCQELLNYAIKYDENNYEPYQVLASLRLSQNKSEEALTFIQKSLNIWKPKSMSIEDDDSENDGEDDESLPSIDFRCTTAKLLLELKQFETASEILERLLEEADYILELHNMLARCYINFDLPAAEETLVHGLEAAEGAVSRGDVDPNDTIITDMKALLSKVKELNPPKRSEDVALIDGANTQPVHINNEMDTGDD